MSWYSVWKFNLKILRPKVQKLSKAIPIYIKWLYTYKIHQYSHNKLRLVTSHPLNAVADAKHELTKPSLGSFRMSVCY